MRALLGVLLGASLLFAALVAGETPSGENLGGPLNFVGKTANVAGAPDSVRIEILRWSTDDEREKLMAAWNLKPIAAPTGRGAGRGPGPGKGAGRAGKGAAKGPAPAADTSAPTPEGALAKALQETTTVGYLWSSETVGYALRYAGRISGPDGSERIILITQRRLGAMNQLWKPTFAGASNTYEFSVIELRLNAKGQGEGKASLVGRVVPDAAAKMVTLENYETAPVILSEVKSKTGHQ
jgi:hypothetical protein